METLIIWVTQNQDYISQLPLQLVLPGDWVLTNGLKVRGFRVALRSLPSKLLPCTQYNCASSMPLCFLQQVRWAWELALEIMKTAPATRDDPGVN